MKQPAIEVKNLVKTYGSVCAVNDLSFSVKQGELFGLLGPNGAGKSSTLSIIEGLRQPDSGTVQLLGMNVQRQPRQVKRRIGVQLQSTSLLPELTAVSQIVIFARLYGFRIGRQAAMALLDEVGLRDKADALPNQLSGGQQQRLALALALVNDPEVLFLDEPTAGLDPQSRARLWELIKNFQAQGRTIVLTTHYMEEAEALCQRVGIIDQGQLLALDSPHALINQHGTDSTLITAVSLPTEALNKLPAVTAVRCADGQTQIHTADVSHTSEALFSLARQHQQPLMDLRIEQPSLEDVFLALTGRTIRNA